VSESGRLCCWDGPDGQGDCRRSSFGLAIPQTLSTNHFLLDLQNRLEHFVALMGISAARMPPGFWESPATSYVRERPRVIGYL